MNGVKGKSQTISTDEKGGHSHGLRSNNTLRDNYGVWGIGYSTVDIVGGKNNGANDYYYYTGTGNVVMTSNGSHTHSSTFTPSLQSTDTETRPNNFTSIIWKRIK